MPVFHLFRLDDIPNLDVFLEVFQSMAKANGFAGIYFVATPNMHSTNVMNREEIKGVVSLDFYINLRYSEYFHFSKDSPFFRLEYWWKKLTTRLFVEGEKQVKPLVLDYKVGLRKMPVNIDHKKHIPCVLPNWDNSPRSGAKSLILKNATPSSFEKYLSKYLKVFKKHQENPPFFIIKSWNEWAEGNYLEPDDHFGKGWLQAVLNARRDNNI